MTYTAVADEIQKAERGRINQPPPASTPWIRNLTTWGPKLALAGLFLIAVTMAWTPEVWLDSTLLTLSILFLVSVGALFPRIGALVPRTIALGLMILISHACFQFNLFGQIWLWGLLRIPDVFILSALVFDLWVAGRRRFERKGRESFVLLWFVIGGALFGSTVILPMKIFFIYGEDLLTWALFSLFLASSGELARLGATLRGRLGERTVLLPGLAGLWIVFCAGLGYAFWEPAGPEPTLYQRAISVRDQLESFYPHWPTAPKGMDELWADHRDELRKAAAGCDETLPCTPLLRGLRDMVGELRNGHTEIQLAEKIGFPGVRVRRVADGVGIVGVEKDLLSEDMRNFDGWELVAVDGIPVEKAIEKVPHWIINFESDRTQELFAYRMVLMGQPESIVEVALKGTEGSPETISLLRQTRGFEIGEGEDPEEFDKFDIARTEESFAYVVMYGFDYAPRIDQLNKEMDKVLEAPGLILDLRGNFGGSRSLVEAFLGRFFTTTTRIGEYCYITVEGEEIFENCEERIVLPKGPVYAGPVGVLIDFDTISGGELGAYALCRHDRGRCFGQPTAGETDLIYGTQEIQEFPEAEFSLSMELFRPAIGPPIKGLGVEPDVLVDTTLADIRNDRDPVYEAACRWLHRQTGTPLPKGSESEPPRCEPPF
jgi:C-terminal processing protease CtpA/Prc